MNYDVVIIGGLGHVGLPLGLVWADAGLTVGALDLDESKKKQVNAGTMPFLEHGAEPILKRVVGKKFFVLNQLSEIATAKAVLITIGTPVDEYLTPQLLVITRLADSLIPHLRPGQHIILRSTVYPGTSERLKNYFAGKGLSLHVSFCPERIVQGHAIRELRELPHIVSSFSDAGRTFCAELFRKLCDKIVEVGVREAELAKLFNNSWRYITFAVANQFYMMSESCGADVREVYRAGHSQTRLCGRAVPAERHDAIERILQQRLQPGLRRHAGQRRAAGLLPGSYFAPSPIAGQEGGTVGHGFQGGSGRHPRFAVVQIAQAVGVSWGRGIMHRRICSVPRIFPAGNRLGTGRPVRGGHSAPPLS